MPLLFPPSSLLPLRRFVLRIAARQLAAEGLDPEIGNFLLRHIEMYFQAPLPLGMAPQERPLLVEALQTAGAALDAAPHLQPRLSTIMDRLHAIIVDGLGTIEERTDFLCVL